MNESNAMSEENEELEGNFLDRSEDETQLVISRNNMGISQEELQQMNKTQEGETPPVQTVKVNNEFAASYGPETSA